MNARPHARPNASLLQKATVAFPRARTSVTRWFRKHARFLPWRRPSGTRRDPYATWISEIMLQQTQVAAVIPYFEKWMKRFPRVLALARAPEDEVLRHWAGLGYYARARNLHRAARSLASQGSYPPTAEAWRALPGVGEYTSGAVASLALNLPEPILDGNVARVLSRFAGLGFLPGDGRAQRQAYWDLARLWARGTNPGDANEGLMELGALLCVPGNPHCARCPLAAGCRAHAQGWEASLPPAKKRPPVETVSGMAWVLRKRGRVLLELRPPGAFLAGHYAFPLFLGEHAGRESARWAKRLSWPGLDASGTVTGTVRHSIMHRRYTLQARLSELGSGRLPTGNEKIRWIPEAELAGFLTNALARKIWRTVSAPVSEPRV